MPELVTAAAAGYLVFRVARHVGERLVIGLDALNAQRVAAEELAAQLDNVPDTYRQAGP